jgi:hypothetical protein
MRTEYEYHQVAEPHEIGRLPCIWSQARASLHRMGWEDMAVFGVAEASSGAIGEMCGRGTVGGGFRRPVAMDGRHRLGIRLRH